MNTMTNTRLLLDSTHNPDARYRAGVEIPDRFFLLETGDKSYIFLDRRELGVFKECSPRTDIEAIPLEPLIDEVRKMKGGSSTAAKLAIHILQTYAPDEKTVEVPDSFPLSMADELREQGYDLLPVSVFCPERAQKSEDEKEMVRSCLEKVLPSLKKIREILAEAEIQKERILYRGEVLTCEFLKQQADKTLIERGMMSTEGMIIASGVQTAIPHHRGNGPVLPHAPIICDIFPRDIETGYFADITRTFVKGQAPENIKRMYQAVAQAQENALAVLKSEIEPSVVHQTVVDTFQEYGFETGEQGFVHATGHGVGLALHEEPYLKSSARGELHSGNLVSIEPGLYYFDIGGVRLEDLVYVTEQGYDNLISYPKELQEL